MSEEIKNEAVETEETSEASESTEETASEEGGEQKETRPIVFEEAIEAILFAAGHPISYATLARVFESTPTKIKEQVMDYAEKYNSSELPRGVILLTYADSCQLCTKKYYLTEIREALGIKRSGTLSTSSLEALAIVAYNQPVTRVFVDTLRRADSSYAMNNLLDRGLIESKGRLDAPGRPMLYGTTTDFLRAFGIPNLEALPRTSEEIDERFDKANKRLAQDAEAQEQLEIPEEIIGRIEDGEKSAEGAENTESPAAEVKEAEAVETAESYEDESSAEDDVNND